VAGECWYGAVPVLSAPSYDCMQEGHKELFYVCLSCAHVCHYPPEE
jgi:hypothetical protein